MSKQLRQKRELMIMLHNNKNQQARGAGGGKNTMRWIFPAIIVMLITAAITISILLFSRNEALKADPASLIPSSCDLFIHMDLLSMADENPVEAVGRWKNTDPYRELKKIVQEKMSIDIDEDFLSWAGPRMCIAAILPEKDSEDDGKALPLQLLVAASVRDGAHLRETMKKVRAQIQERDGTVYAQSALMGAELFSPDRDGHPFFARYKNFFLIGNELDLISAAIETAHKKRENIIKSPSYKEVINADSGLPSARLLTLYYKARVNKNFAGRKGARDSLETAGAWLVKQKDGNVLIHALLSFDPDLRLAETSDQTFQAQQIIPGDSSLFILVNRKNIESVCSLLEIPRKKRRSLSLVPYFEAHLPARLKRKCLDDEGGLILDLGSAIGRTFSGKAPKSLEQVPQVLVLKLKDKESEEELDSALKIESGLTAGNYRDYAIFTGNDLSFSRVGNYLILSRNNSESLLKKVIDTRCGSTSIVEKPGYKVLAERRWGKDMLLTHADFTEISFPMKILSAFNPVAGRIAALTESYNGAWIKVSGENNKMMTEVFLEGK